MCPPSLISRSQQYRQAVAEGGGGVRRRHLEREISGRLDVEVDVTETNPGVGDDVAGFVETCPDHEIRVAMADDPSQQQRSAQARLVPRPALQEPFHVLDPPPFSRRVVSCGFGLGVPFGSGVSEECHPMSAGYFVERSRSKQDLGTKQEHRQCHDLADVGGPEPSEAARGVAHRRWHSTKHTREVSGAAIVGTLTSMRAASNDVARSYVCHGVEVLSDVRLGGLTESESRDGLGDSLRIDADAAVDDVVRVGRVDEIDTSADDGSLIARDHTGAGWLEMRDVDGVWTIRAEGIYMRVDADALSLDVATDGSVAAEASVGWLVGGLGLAAVLMKRGAMMMHGSLVRYRERGMLFMAPSGHGKSLCAAAAVSAGARLVAEDTVRIDESVEAGRRSFSAPQGSTILRLRRPLDEVERLLPGRPVVVSSDGRAVVRCDAPFVRSSVDRLVFIKLDPEATDVTVLDMDPITTLQTCMGHSRVPGIVDSRVAAHVFDQVGGLIDVLPAQVFQLPWNGDTTRLVAHLGACLEAV